ncbi:MAG: hypothetical protein AAF587_10610 [Bacteroidota bacterium]
MYTTVLLTISLILSCSIWAQRSPSWLSGNDRGNRFEGSYTAKVSNPSINLISLTGSFEPYEFGKRQELSVQFFSPQDQSYFLSSEELRVTRFYWMQAKNVQAQKGWNNLDQWPVDFLLKRFRIDYRNLGVLVRLGKQGSRQFAPAWVFHSQTPSAFKRYIAQLQLGRSAADGRFQIYRGKSKKAANLIQQGKITAKSGGTAFPIVIPAQVLPSKEGWITVAVHLREKGSLDPFSYSFSFYHQQPNK